MHFLAGVLSVLVLGLISMIKLITFYGKRSKAVKQKAWHNLQDSFSNNKIVTGITYDSHDALVIKSFEEIYNEAEEKLNIKDKAVFIEHAKGYLNLGDISIIIAVACKHRDEAYVLSRYIIEEIKKRSPIWKKEHYQNNETDWLKGNPIQYEKN